MGALPRAAAARRFRPETGQGIVRFKQAERAGPQLIRAAAGHKIHKSRFAAPHSRQPHKHTGLPCRAQQGLRAKLAPDAHIEGHGAGILPQCEFHQPALRRLAADFGQLGRLLRPQTAHNFTHIVSGLSRSIGQLARKIARQTRWRSIRLIH